MKKILVLLLAVSMIAAAFVGCSDKPDSGAFGSTSADTNGNGLRDDVELEIMESHYSDGCLLKNKEFSPSNYDVKYFGTYKGALAVRITCKGVDYLSSGNKEVVGNITFSYGSGSSIDLWVKGRFYSLTEAHFNGILTDEDVEAIYSAFVKK